MDVFEKRRLSFEAEYFQRKDKELVDQLKSVFHRQRSKEEIRQATGVSDEGVLAALVELNLSGELMSAFRLLPLVEVAWADGEVDAREADAVLTSVEHLGVTKGTPAYAMLENSLRNPPRPDARTAWYALAGELRKVLSAEQLQTFRDDLLVHLRQVAQASGGLLGIAFTVSANEQAVLDSVARALTPSAA